MITRLWKSPFFGILLWPFASLFRLAVSVRRSLFSSGILKSHKAEISVISIGNLTVGGTGKTPCVIFFAAALQKLGYKPAIISRGYGRKSKSQIIVSDGMHIHQPIDEAGDEPSLLAKRLPGIPVIVDKSRAAAISTAQKQFGSNLVILDDGFQHLKVQRDLDIIVIDGSNPWGNGFMLPAGPLRDPKSQLKKADAVILTRTDQTNFIQPLIERIRKITDAPLFTSSHRPGHLISLKTGKKLKTTEVLRKKVICFTGIGNPGSFRQTVESTGFNVESLLTFPDHHWYSQEDMTSLSRKASELDVCTFMTTEKDAVRLKYVDTANLNIYYLQVDLFINEPEAFNLFINDFHAGGLNGM